MADKLCDDIIENKHGYFYVYDAIHHSLFWKGQKDEIAKWLEWCDYAVLEGVTHGERYKGFSLLRILHFGNRWIKLLEEQARTQQKKIVYMDVQMSYGPLSELVSLSEMSLPLIWRIDRSLVLDYRNLVAASKAIMFAKGQKEYADRKPRIMLIYGSLHSKGIRRYLSRTEEITRAIKKYIKNPLTKFYDSINVTEKHHDGVGWVVKSYELDPVDFLSISI